MQKQLQLLRDLQELDTEKRTVDNEKQAGLNEQSSLQTGLDRLQGMIDSLTSEISVIEADRKELTDAMAIEQENIQRSEGRLPQIKTQKEYVAVLKEIDTAKKLSKELQAKIDAKDEALLSLQSDKEEKDAEFSQAKEAADARCAEIDSSLTSVNAKLEEMEAQRKELLKDLPNQLRKRYELLMSRRGGVAVVEAHGGACLGCHMHLPPQLFNSLFVVNDIQTCPHCNRLLYVTAQD